MRCAAAKRLISDHLDGGLSQNQEAKLKDHLAACPDCRSLAEDFQRVAQEAKRLSSLLPSPAAWQKIVAQLREAGPEARSAQEERTGRFSLTWVPAGWRYALAGALALVIIGGGLYIGLRTQGMAGKERYTLAKLKEAQRYYVLAIKALDEAIGAQKNGLDPGLAQIFEVNLKEINGTIRTCEQIVEEDPNNLAARAYLLTVYRDKVTILEEMMGAKKASSEKRTALAL